MLLLGAGGGPTALLLHPLLDVPAQLPRLLALPRPTRPRQSWRSFGKMSSLMMTAVRIRMSLMRSSSVGMGLTAGGVPLTADTPVRPGRRPGKLA